MKSLAARWIRITALLLMICAAPVLADEYDAGMTAYKSGDYETARNVWMPMAEEGVVGAQYGIAVMYENGHGVPKDEAKALEWYLRAAEQGDANAQFMAAVIYGRGTAVKYDLFERLKWYHKAAEQGHIMAQFFLAMSYFEGNGAPQDSVLGFFWANLALESTTGPDAQGIRDFIDRVTATMTDEEIADAEHRVERWHKSKSGELEAEAPAPAVEVVAAEPAPPTSAEDAGKVTGAWLLRVARQPTSVDPVVAEDASEFTVTFDHGPDGTLVGTIHLPDGSDSPLDRAYAEGANLSFSFRTREVAGTMSDDGSAVSGSLQTLDGKDYAFTMSRVID